MKFDLVVYDRDSFSIYAYKGKDYVGYVTVNFNYIAGLKIEEKYQHRGYGSRLLACAERRIIRMGYKTIVLDALSTDEKPDELHRFYIKNGYFREYNDRYCKILVKACC